MNKKEIEDLSNTIEDNIPIEEYRSEGTSDGLCHYELDEDSWQYKTLKYIKQLQQENQQLKKQLEDLRSGEYYNQLRFERDMLQNVVDNGEVPKEDKEFIDMTHRNTELLEQLKQRDEVVEELEEFLKEFHNYENRFKWCEQDYIDTIEKFEEILQKRKGDNK